MIMKNIEKQWWVENLEFDLMECERGRSVAVVERLLQRAARLGLMLLRRNSTGN